MLMRRLNRRVRRIALIAAILLAAAMALRLLMRAWPDL
jgi:hypothetical protein